MRQQRTSFSVLYPKALRPGGIYFVEDLQTSVLKHYIDEQPTMSELIKNDLLTLMHEQAHSEQGTGFVEQTWSVDCSRQLCAYSKIIPGYNY